MAAFVAAAAIFLIGIRWFLDEKTSRQFRDFQKPDAGLHRLENYKTVRTIL